MVHKILLMFYIHKKHFQDSRPYKPCILDVYKRQVWGQYIEKLSEYMASTGKRYQSHAATIRRWAGEDAKKAAPPTRNRDYSVKEDETV